MTNKKALVKGLPCITAVERHSSGLNFAESSLSQLPSSSAQSHLANDGIKDIIA